ncbi:MAG: hypothetical protein RBS72_20650 [Sedimentisphaerales bacterium]|jgi:hypothetical protein|nr:hypothetical protein [Sedimentisphaerales bacterium]HNY80362.1 hypothetical protein [Sedimentisphaerales bacterium]HOC65659.1 hypothetical protein [Sedimentisphaerales bacterium]HOH66148.1 hypothetical protein [Sedimentisphaerales bacterium]HQA90847.1 hypothetical protein [Sedimentisphaerales bacterium]
MKRQSILAAGIIALWALSVQGAVPATLPTIEVQFNPTSPTSADTVALTLSGTWPNACVPQTFLAQVVPGDSIRIDLLLPGWDSKDGCEPPLCLQVLTPWQLSGAIPALPAGSYDVFIRAMDCEEAGSYRQVTALTVTPGVGGPLSDVFAPGERIVLLESDPPGGFGLAAGQSGTVICCDAEDCSGSILVSWDLWADGKLDLVECANGTETLYPPNSAIWINPNQVLLGRHFNQCGTIRKVLEGCISFEADDGKTYNVIAWPGLYSTLDAGGAIQFDDRVRLQGLLNTTPPRPDELRLCLQQDGDIFHPTLTPCSPADAEPEPKPEPEPEPKPEPGPDSIVINIAGNPLVLQQAPSSPGTYAGCANLTIELNFHAQLSVKITPAPGVGGTWRGTLDPDVLGPGTVTTELCIEVVDLDISSLPPGKDVQVATVTLLAAPAI